MAALEYKDRISAGEGARHPARRGIIFKLRANPLDVRRQIDELNRALRMCRGNDPR